MWTYNFTFLVLALIGIGVFTHFIAKFTHLVHSALCTLMIIIGIASAGIVFYIFSAKIPQRIDRELIEKMGYIEYQVHILPKVTPWSKEVKLCFNNKDTNARIEIVIDSKLDSTEIYQKIKDLQPHISEILKYP